MAIAFEMMINRWYVVSNAPKTDREWAFASITAVGESTDNKFMLHANVHRTMLTKYLPYVQVEKMFTECAEQSNEKIATEKNQQMF